MYHSIAIFKMPNSTAMGGNSFEQKIIGIGINPDGQQKIKSLIPLSEKMFEDILPMVTHVEKMKLCLFEENEFNSLSIKFDNEYINSVIKGSDEVEKFITAMFKLMEIIMKHNASQKIFHK